MSVDTCLHRKLKNIHLIISNYIIKQMFSNYADIDIIPFNSEMMGTKII